MGSSPQQKPDLSRLKIDERARKRGSLAGRIGVFVVLAALALATMAFVSRIRAAKPVVEVTAARSGKERPAALLNASGYITPRRRATVASKITGQVTSVTVDEGMRVQEGQVLATLDDSDARRRLEFAHAERQSMAASIADLTVNLADAERELKRAQELQAAGVQTVQAVDRARTAVESLQARIALAKEQVRTADARIRVAQQDVDNCVIRAPFAGLVVSRDAQIGEIVSPVSAGGGFTRTGIVTIVDMQSLEVEVDVNESYIARVKPGQPVMATLDAYPNWDIPARVRTVIPTADRQKATVKVRISFVKLDPRMVPDMGVKVAFLKEAPAAQPPDTSAQAIIPAATVRKENGASVVYVVRDGHLQRRTITPGKQEGDDLRVLAGIAEGDLVVLRAAGDLRDGLAVAVK